MSILKPRVIQFFGILAVVLLSFGVLTMLLVVPEFDRLRLGPIQLIGGFISLLIFVVGGGAKSLREISSHRRRAAWGLNVFLSALLFAGLLIVVNLIVRRHVFWRYDSTSEKVYTLAPQTVSVLSALQSPVLVRGFYLEGRADRAVQDLFSRVEGQFPGKLEFRVIDPEKNPGLASRLGISQTGTLHFSFVTPDKDGVTREAKLVGKVREQEIVNGLMKLNRTSNHAVCIPSGHGEPELSSNLESGLVFAKEAIEGENLTVKEIKLADGDSSTTDCSVLALIAPKKPLLPIERQVLTHFAESGRGLLLFHEPNGSEDIREIADSLQIEIGKNVIVQDVGTLLGNRLVAFELTVSSYGNHPITKGFSEYTSFSLASSARAKKGAKNVTELAFSSDKTWAETDLAAAFADPPVASPDPNEEQGPISIAAAFVGPFDAAATKPTRVVVFGDGDFIANANIRQVFNRDFFLNSLQWVLGESDSVTIRPSTMRLARTPIPAEQRSFVFLLTTILLPELILTIGLLVWWLRR